VTVETEPVKVSVDVPERTVLVDPAAVDTEITVVPAAVDIDVTVVPAAVETDVLVTYNVCKQAESEQVWEEEFAYSCPSCGRGNSRSWCSRNRD